MKFCLMFCCLKFTVIFFHSFRGFNFVNKCFYCNRFCVDYENILHKLDKKLFFNRSFFGGFMSRDDHAIFSLLRQPFFLLIILKNLRISEPYSMNMLALYLNCTCFIFKFFLVFYSIT